MSRLRIEVSLNGRPLCTAGLDLPGRVDAGVRYIRIANADKDWAPELFASTPECGDYELCEVEVRGGLHETERGTRLAAATSGTRRRVDAPGSRSRTI